MSLTHLLMLFAISGIIIALVSIKPREALFIFIFCLMAFNDYIGGLPSSVIKVGEHLFFAADFFIVLLIVGLIRASFKKNSIASLDRPVLIAMVILSLYGIVGVLNGFAGEQLYNDIIGGYRRYFYYPWAVFIPMLLLRGSKDIHTIEKVVFVAAPFICLFAFYRILIGQTYFPESHAYEHDYFRAMGFHDYILLLFVICLAMGKILLHKEKSIVLKAYLLILPLFIIASNYRAAWALLILCPLVMLFLLRSRGISLKPLRRTLLFSGLVVILVVILAKISGNEVYQAVESRMFGKVVNYTFKESQRDFFWKEVFAEWQLAPWMGVGLGQMLTYDTKNRHGEWIVVEAGSLHNSYLELGLKTGVFGLVLFLVFQYMIIIRLLRVLKQENFFIPFASAGIVLIIAVLLQAGIQPILNESNSVILIYLIIGTVLSVPCNRMDPNLEVRRNETAHNKR